MDFRFSISKPVLQSRTLWIVLFAIVLIMIMSIIDSNPDKDVPEWIVWMITGAVGLLVPAEKIKDATVGVSKIMAEPVKSFINLPKPLVSDAASNLVASIGILLTTIYGVLVANGAEIGADYILAIDSLMVLFVGADKYKTARLSAAESFKKKPMLGQPVRLPAQPAPAVPHPALPPEPPQP